MAIMNPDKAFENETIHCFGGIKSTQRLSSLGAADMRNFRILADGSLEKRSGYRKWFSFPSALRGVWEGEIEGISYFFAVSGSTVYRLSSDQQTTSTVFVLSTSEGPVCFAFYNDCLYLFDGESILRYLPSTGFFKQADGYTPLYGNLWHPTQLGPVHEPLNLVQNRIRIRYLNTTGAISFRLPFTMKRIDRVYVNGALTSDFVFNTSDMTVELSSGISGSTVEICATLDNVFDRRPSVSKAFRAIVYRDPHHETLLCCGGSPGYFVYRSSPVSAEMLQESALSYSNSDPLYIPEKGVFCVGSVQHPVTAMCQCGEQVLVTNDRALWAIRHVEDSLPDMRVYLLRSDIGCISPNGMTAEGGDLITLSDSGIYQLKFQTSDPSSCSATCLSDDIASCLNSDALKRAVLFLHRPTKELWLVDPSDALGTVWIRSMERDTWVAYDGIRANILFERHGSLNFSTVFGDLCFMDDALDTDDDTPFAAYYVSHYLPFDRPSFQKRTLRASLCVDSAKGVLSVSLESDRGGFEQSFSGISSDTPEFFDMRTTLGRFRFLRFSFSTFGTERIRIHSLSVSANN